MNESKGILILKNIRTYLCQQTPLDRPHMRMQISHICNFITNTFSQTINHDLRFYLIGYDILHILTMAKVFMIPGRDLMYSTFILCFSGICTCEKIGGASLAYAPIGSSVDVRCSVIMVR